MVQTKNIGVNVAVSEAEIINQTYMWPCSVICFKMCSIDKNYRAIQPGTYTIPQIIHDW